MVTLVINWYLKFSINSVETIKIYKPLPASKGMPAQIIDGEKIAKEITADLKKRIAALPTKPGLALIIVGDNPASKMYVNKKEKNCHELGVYCERYNLTKETTPGEILELITKLNESKKIHGILVQLPLPSHIDEHLILDAILPYKDVDGFTPVNLGNLVAGTPILMPATPRAIVRLIESTGVPLEGKHAVVVGRSRIVGKPVALMLLEKNATVSLCHSKTKQLAAHTTQADILVAAVGKPRMITKEMVKPGAVVIDVGINREFDTVVGDVDFESVKEVAGFITPVPKGVGPMTIVMLMENVLLAKQMIEKINL